MYVCMYAYIHAMSVHLVFTYGLTYININYTHATYVMQDSPEVPSWLLTLFLFFSYIASFFCICGPFLVIHCRFFSENTHTRTRTHTHTHIYMSYSYMRQFLHMFVFDIHVRLNTFMFVTWLIQCTTPQRIILFFAYFSKYVQKDNEPGLICICASHSQVYCHSIIQNVIKKRRANEGDAPILLRDIHSSYVWHYSFICLT